MQIQTLDRCLIIANIPVPFVCRVTDVNSNATKQIKAFYKGNRVLIISLIEPDKMKTLKIERESKSVEIISLLNYPSTNMSTGSLVNLSKSSFLI